MIPLLIISFQNICMSAVVNPKDRKKAFKQKKDENAEKEKLFMMISHYQISDKEIGNGVSSKVYAAIDINTQEKVAIKKIKNFLENKHESLRILREILLLRKLKHPNIINLKEIIVEGEDSKKLSLVLEFLPTDVKKIFKSNRILTPENIKRIIFQILLGLHYCQQSQVLHRDLKPENVLITDDLSCVKLCDFGLARAVYLQKDQKQQKEEAEVNSMVPEEEEKPKHVNPHAPTNKNNLTAHVSTRWYRAPELIILERKYSNAIDIWSVGCILGELMTMLEDFSIRKPLFPGKACYPLSPPKTPDMNYKKINDFPHSVHDQLSVIFGIIGTPKDIDFISDERAKNYIKSFGYKERIPFNKVFSYLFPHVEDFLLHSLEFNPNKRMTISEAINHPLFDDIRGDYNKNLEIKGEPINMEVEGIDIPQIKQMVLNEYQYYQSTKMQ